MRRSGRRGGALQVAGVDFAQRAAFSLVTSPVKPTLSMTDALNVRPRESSASDLGTGRTFAGSDVVHRGPLEIAGVTPGHVPLVIKGE